AFGDRGGLGASVEDDQYPGVEAEPVEVAVELGQPPGQWVGFVLPPHLQFEGVPLQGLLAGRSLVGPADEQVDAAAAGAVLPVDVAAAVDDALQVAHEHQLRGDLVVGDSGGEHVGVLTPERGELVQYQVDVEPAVAADEAVRVGDDFELHVGREYPYDDFTVD